ncbi:MAG: glycerol-3-phosphate dehydrogenase [Verrucomicrobiota bacterium]
MKGSVGKNPDAHSPVAAHRDRRVAALQSLLKTPLDVLVIGGGIVGAGVARDAAMRGLRTGLIEQHDFAFGTSSRSSRLLHGGLRYLAQGRLGLVREGSAEKRILHRIAPHLAEPLAFVFPTYRGTDWPLWQLRIGIKIYDLLCRGKNFGTSGAMNRDGVLKLIPKLKPDQLTGCVRYFDALTNDARLVLDTLRSAEKSRARLLNYLKFKSARREAVGWVCELEDRLTGGFLEVRASAVVNATGPWAGGVPHSHVHLRLTKGIHLVIDRSRLAVPDAIVLTDGKRILFVIPWGERIILGTTDTDYAGDIDDVRADSADIAYVLRITNEFFPAIALTEADVSSVWAGLRPLLANPNGGPSDISRSHQITNPEPAWWDVAGGKLTTYRLIAEQTVDKLVKSLKKLNALHSEPARCRTAREPLLPAGEVFGISGILPSEFSRRAVEHFCANEWAVNLEDVMVRRSRWHYYFRDAGQKAEQVAEWMTELLGWSSTEKASQLENYRRANDFQPGRQAILEKQRRDEQSFRVV